MDILSSLFHQPRSHRGGHRGVGRSSEYSYSIAPTLSPKRKRTIIPTVQSNTTPNAPKFTTRKQPSKSTQRKTASGNLRHAISLVLCALEDRGLSPKILKELKDHLAFYEYSFILTKSTTCFRRHYPQDEHLIRLLSEAWTCQWRYLQVVIHEADQEYWRQQEQQVFVPIKEAEYRLRLERALARCQEIREDLCELQVGLSLA